MPSDLHLKNRLVFSVLNVRIMERLYIIGLVCGGGVVYIYIYYFLFILFAFSWILKFLYSIMYDQEKSLSTEVELEEKSCDKGLLHLKQC